MISVIRKHTVFHVFSVIVKVLTNTCGVQAVLCWGCPIKIHCVKGVKRPCMVTCQAFVWVVGIVCVSTCGLVCLQSARHAVTVGNSVVSEFGARCSGPEARRFMKVCISHFA